MNLDDFEDIIIVDAEYATSDDGYVQTPVSFVGKSVRTGTIFSKYREELDLEPPVPVGPKILYVSYNISAEIDFHLCAGQPLPRMALCLRAEFMNRVNGLKDPRAPKGEKAYPTSLIDALQFHGISHMDFAEKKDLQMRLAADDSTLTKKEVVLYNAQDVKVTERLFRVMAPGIDLKRALIRSRYLTAIARAERAGIPVDVPVLEKFLERSKDVQLTIIHRLDQHCIYDEHGRWSNARFINNVLIKYSLRWPLLKDGETPSTTEETFGEMADLYPELIRPIHKLRELLKSFRSLKNIPYNKEGMSRTWLNPHGTTTGRNAPKRYLLAKSKVFRGLIAARPDLSLGYLDWGGQEIAIAGYLSCDENLIRTYWASDPYIYFGNLIGIIPEGGTKATHLAEREMAKVCFLASNYGQGPLSFSRRIGMSLSVAKAYLDEHQQVYRRYWEWAEEGFMFAQQYGYLDTQMGWRLNLQTTGPKSTKRNTIINHRVQGAGADMFKWAFILAWEMGVQAVGPLHDGILITSPPSQIEEDTFRMKGAMDMASRLILRNAPPLKVETQIIHYPGRFLTAGAQSEWDGLMDQLAQAPQKRLHP